MVFSPFDSERELRSAICATPNKEIESDPRFYCKGTFAAFALCAESGSLALYACLLGESGEGTRRIYPLVAETTNSKREMIENNYIAMILCERLGLEDEARTFRNSAWYLEDHLLASDEVVEEPEEYLLPEKH